MTLSQNESAQSTSHVDLAMVYMKRFMVWIKINNSLLESIQIVILIVHVKPTLANLKNGLGSRLKYSMSNIA